MADHRRFGVVTREYRRYTMNLNILARKLIYRSLPSKDRRRWRHKLHRFDRTASRIEGWSGDQLKSLFYNHFFATMDSITFCRVIRDGTLNPDKFLRMIGIDSIEEFEKEYLKL